MAKKVDLKTITHYMEVLNNYRVNGYEYKDYQSYILNMIHTNGATYEAIHYMAQNNF